MQFDLDTTKLDMLALAEQIEPADRKRLSWWAKVGGWIVGMLIILAAF